MATIPGEKTVKEKKQALPPPPKKNKKTGSNPVIMRKELTYIVL
jgi:hypothetical protein